MKCSKAAFGEQNKMKGTIIKNKNYRKLNQNYPKFQGVFLKQFTSIKSSIIDKNQETII